MDTCDMKYDIVVIGAGMIGSAAAKYIALTDNPRLKVCLIGPREPEKKCDAQIHGAHYDEGRIARRVDRDPVWGVMSVRSMDVLSHIERTTGLPIFSEVGFAAIGTEGEEYISKYKTLAEHRQMEHTFLSTGEAVKKAFPFADLGSNVQGLYTKTGSGFINPRNLVEAQKRIAQENGCEIIEDIVEWVDQSDSDQYAIHTEGGRVVLAGKVLLCTGAFTHFRKLLPEGVVPRVEHHRNSVIMVEVDEDECQHLKNMPCIAFKAGPWDRPEYNLVAYIMPPVKYPDGKWYLKLGHGNLEPAILKTPREITEWYWCGKEPKVDALLYVITRKLFPGLKMKNYKYDYCVTTNTPQGYPYVDMVTKCMGVAIAGCGCSAKCSDELGRMAARMIVKGSWDHDLPKDLFKFEADNVLPTSKI